MIVSAKLTQAQRVYLDFVRASAAMCVMLGHASSYFLAGSFLSHGQVPVAGVLVFFLISGFLISLSVFQKHADRSYGFREYFADRFCRIYCAYFPALILVAAVDYFIAGSPLYNSPNPINDGNHYDLHTWVGNLLMFQGFPLFQALKRFGFHTDVWNIGPFGSADTFWTISIEWWIYMFFGMVVYFGMRSGKPLRLWQWLVLGFVAVEPVYHFVGGPDLCLTMLWGIGMGASLLFLSLPVRAAGWEISVARWRNICLIAGAASVFAAVAHLYANLFHLHQMNIADLQFGVFLATAIFSFFFAMGTVRHVPAFIEKTCAFFANYSYSLYLTHLTVFWYAFVRYPGHEHDPRMFWGAIAAANVVAIAFWLLFEHHHRAFASKLKTVLQPVRQPDAPAVDGRHSWSAGTALPSSGQLRANPE